MRSRSSCERRAHRVKRLAPRGNSGYVGRREAPSAQGGRHVARWTRFVIRNRKKVLALWAIVFVISGMASSGLADLLTNRFSVPGSDAEKGLDLLKDRFGERGDGGFTLVFQPTGDRGDDPAFQRDAQAAADRGAKAVKGGKAGPVRFAGENLMYAQISSILEN